MKGSDHGTLVWTSGGREAGWVLVPRTEFLVPAPARIPLLCKAFMTLLACWLDILFILKQQSLLLSSEGLKLL